MIGYIYALWDKDENDIFYIGASVNIKARLLQHRLYFANHKNCQLSVIADVFFDIKRELFSEEAYWINTFRSWGFDLENKDFYKNFNFNQTTMTIDFRQYDDECFEHVLLMQKKYHGKTKSKPTLPQTVRMIIKEHKKMTSIIRNVFPEDGLYKK